MFEHVVLRKTERGDPISIGRLAEALLYYQKVHVIIDRGTLFNFIQQIGPDQLLSILRRPDITAVYCEEMLGTKTESVGVLEVHNLIAFTLSGHETVGPLVSPEDRIVFELEHRQIERGIAKRFAKQFLKLVPIRKFSGKHFIKDGIPATAKRDVLDVDFFKNAVRRILSLSPGGYDPGENFKLELLDTDLGLYFFHDLDLSGVNQRRAQLSPRIEPLTVAHILSLVQDASADLAISSFYGGDFFTSDITSSVIQARHEVLLRRTQMNLDARSQFIEVALPDSPTLSEVIDSGERSVNDAMLLIDKATRFKDWLKSVNPDEGLVRTYMRDVCADSWVQRLPTKSLRYMLTLALESAHPIAGLAAGFSDNFLVEKLLGGWRPNHFIESRLAPFLSGRQS